MLWIRISGETMKLGGGLCSHCFISDDCQEKNSCYLFIMARWIPKSTTAVSGHNEKVKSQVKSPFFTHWSIKNSIISKLSIYSDVTSNSHNDQTSKRLKSCILPECFSVLFTLRTSNWRDETLPLNKSLEWHPSGSLCGHGSLKGGEDFISGSFRGRGRSLERLPTDKMATRQN